jgi:hypothetical protein
VVASGADRLAGASGVIRFQAAGGVQHDNRVGVVAAGDDVADDFDRPPVVGLPYRALPGTRSRIGATRSKGGCSSAPTGWDSGSHCRSGDSACEGGASARCLKTESFALLVMTVGVVRTGATRC